MRSPFLCACLLSLSLTLPAAGQLAQERWMMMIGARNQPRSAATVHINFFHSKQTVRTSRATVAVETAPVRRPAPPISRPAAARPPVVVAQAPGTQTAPSLIASHAAGVNAPASAQGPRPARLAPAPR